jgi:AcrR family transcriptional regulator
VYTSFVARLDRDSVLRAGLELAEDDGLEAVTLRNLAARVGVTPMALYRHVAGKDDLLDGMTDLVYAELAIPQPEGDWWSELAALARSTRRLLLAHPVVAPLFARPLAGPISVKLGQALIDTLYRAGFDGPDVHELHTQLSQMVFSLILTEIRADSASRPARDEAFERGIELLHAGLIARLKQR